MRNKRLDFVVRLLTVVTILIGLAGPLAPPVVAAASYTLDGTTCASVLGGMWNTPMTSFCTLTADATIPASDTLVVPAGTGVLVGIGTLTVNGRLEVRGGVTVQGGALVNNGTLVTGYAGQPAVILGTTTGASGINISSGTGTNTGTIENYAIVIVTSGASLTNSGQIHNYCGSAFITPGTFSGNTPTMDYCTLDAARCATLPGSWDAGTSTCSISGTVQYNTNLVVPSGVTLKITSAGVFANMAKLRNEGTILNQGALGLAVPNPVYPGLSIAFDNATGGAVENLAQMISAGPVTNLGVMRNRCGGLYTSQTGAVFVGSPIEEAPCNLDAWICSQNVGAWNADTSTCTVPSAEKYLFIDLTVPAGVTLSIPAGGSLYNMSDLTNQGTINNAGMFGTTSAGSPTGSSTMTNGGVLNNTGYLVMQGGTFGNNGTINNGTAPTMATLFQIYSGTLTNSSSGVINNRSGIMNYGTIANSGLVRNFCGGDILDQSTGVVTGVAPVNDVCVLNSTTCAYLTNGTWAADTSTCSVSGEVYFMRAWQIPAGTTVRTAAGTNLYNHSSLSNAGRIVNYGTFFMSLDDPADSATSSLVNTGLVDNYLNLVNLGLVQNNGAVQQQCGATYLEELTLLNNPFVPPVTLSGTWTGNDRVNACNVAPVAVADAYTATEDTTLTVAANGVLGNDTDTENNPLTAVLVSGAAFGSVTLNSDGSFSYTPNPNHNGSDKFKYKANDGTSDSNEVFVIITVTAVDDPPVAVNDSYSLVENQTLQVSDPGVMANDYDIDSGGNLVDRVSGPAHGTLDLSPSGGFQYAPNAGWCGTDSFVYRSSNPGANGTGNTAAVTLNITCVNNAPVAVADSYSTSEDRAINESVPGVLGNDSDGDGDPLTAHKTGNPSHGTVTLNTDGSFIYTPAANYYGPDAFTYQVYDGLAYSANTTVSITVNPVNDEPVVVDDFYIATEATVLTISAAAGVLANDSDIEGSPLSVFYQSGPWRGSATLNADGSFTYTPWSNLCGTDSFQYQARDTGMAQSNYATVIIEVTCVNDAPVLNDIPNKTVNELAALTFTASATDADGTDTLTFSLVTPPTGASINGATGEFTWTPTEAQGAGSHAVTVKVCDNGALCDQQTITVTVNEVNSAPVLAAIGNKSVNEMVALTFTASATDSDSGSGAKTTLTYSLDGAPTGASITPAGAFSWTPTEEQGPGSYPLTVRVCDNGAPALCDEETITVSVSEVNSAPVLYPVGNKTIDEEATLGFLATAYDVYTGTGVVNTLTFSMTGAPDGATITAGGSFTWTPTEAQGAGSYTFTVKVCDNGTPSLCAEEAITVTVNEVNRAPALDAIAPQTVDEMTELTLAVTASDPDTGAGAATTLTYTFASPTHGASLTAGGAFSWMPTESQGYEVHTFLVRVCDNGATPLCDTGSFTVTVNEVNREPELNPVGDKAVNEMTPLTFSATGSDPDTGAGAANVLNYTLIDAPAGATMTEGGALAWTPTEEQGYGTYTFTVKVCDDGDQEMCDSEAITVTVNEVNRNPVLDAIEDQTTPWGNVVSFTATATDPDTGTGAANQLTYSLVNAPLHAAIDAESGAFSWTPGAYQVGVNTFTVKVCDDGVEPLCAEQPVTITVEKRATRLEYWGDTYGQYSDPIGLQVVLTDDSGGALQGSGVRFDPITVVIGTDSADLRSHGGRGFGSLVLTQPAGALTLTATFDGNSIYLGSSDTAPFTVTAEDAAVAFDSGNAAALQDSTPGGALNAEALSLTVTVREKRPDLVDGSEYPVLAPLPGEIGHASLSVMLVPLAGGSPVTLSCTGVTAGTGYDGVKTFTCGNVATLPVNTYDVIATVTHGYYAGTNYDGFTVYDPSLGFATGGGWFYWPGTTDKTNFGFTMKYNRKGTSAQGNLIIVRHYADGTIARLKSNSLDGLALIDSGGLGIATFSGKSTYTVWDPAALGGLGDYVTYGGTEFTVYAEDGNNPGTGADRFWVRSTGELTMESSAADNAVVLSGGNIAVPHKVVKTR